MKNSHGKNGSTSSKSVLVAFLRLAIAVGITLELLEALWMNAAIGAGILLLTFLPTIFASRIQVKIPPEFEVLTVAFIFASLFLGETRGFYSKFWWWDITLHTTSGVLLGILGLLLVYVLNETPRLILSKASGICLANESVSTSARRWLRLCVWRAVGTNQLWIVALHLGVSPQRLARWYSKQRTREKSPG